MNTTIELPDACLQTLEEHLQPELFKSLCDPTRLSIVAFLATQSQAVSVGALAEQYGIDFSGVSRHLKILKQAGVVKAEKQGREVNYSLKTQYLTQTLRGFADALEACCPDNN